MRHALASTHIEGIATNILLHAALMNDKAFMAGGVHTSHFPGFLETYLKTAVDKHVAVGGT